MIEEKDLIRNEVRPVLEADSEFELSTFSDANLSEIELSNKIFTECIFENCDLSLAKLLGTHFKQVTFKNCKMLGLQFENCNPFLLEMHFDNCLLNHSSFYAMNLSNSSFNVCKMHETDFTEVVLKKAKIVHCDLLKARFDRTNAELTNFSHSYNLEIDPMMNQISGATFSQNALPGLLERFSLKIIP